MNDRKITGGETNPAVGDGPEVSVEQASKMLATAAHVGRSADPLTEQAKLHMLRQAMLIKVSQVAPSGRAAFMTQFDFVCQFHALMDTWYPITRTPEPADVERRFKIINEEVNVELFPLLEALRTGAKEFTIETRAELLDHLVDSVYVLLGTAAEFGLPFDMAFELIHMSNMNKFANGVKKNEYGKLMKPEGWKPPTIELHNLVMQHWKEATLTDSDEHRIQAGKETKTAESVAGNSAGNLGTNKPN